ncbi:type I-D CRISPR-associated protein Cas10d/Csc3 [Anabaena sp. UHCC 0451]|uniref:type I-D CRISPR-associated protein Cas10d/Csc3 n=1 Tax=Anabaena sp. UHCC 0451 TaxID=2055235 RepID=UPI002B1F877D|nr:type I-D CRISPR-associated protein Cas10d/Csc3 [Anabaena sp. UHCC 0451]MEA5574893.1 type I-D CRISPR-associated protein Cas10d/Csc3 [Anabaena sp. UHCC 0451]
MSEYLQFLGLEDQSILTLFIEEVANKGLQQYQQIIQWGGHQGQSLYNHVVSGVFLIHSLEKILQLSTEELKVLTIAFCIHDLNKSYGGTETSYGKIAVPENVVKEIEKIGYDSFFSDWRDYVEDITEIIRGHSGHNSVRGDSLDRRSDNTQLSKARLIELCKIIRAADVADLSQGYSERKHKQDFLSHINSFTQRQYCLIAHQVSEQRGIFTNIIHNQVADFLATKFQASPVFLYPQGTHYLVPVNKNLNLEESDIVKIGQLVEQKIIQMKSEEWSKFIENGNQGIKIKQEILKLGISYSEIFGHINTLIQKKQYKLDEKEKELRKKMLEKNSESAIQYWIDQSRIMPNSQDMMRLGELLKTFYIFLSDHCKKLMPGVNKGKNDPWLYLYQILDIKDYEQYEPLDARYDRAYVIAKLCTLIYDELLVLIIDKSNQLLPIKEEEKTANISNIQISPITSYVTNNITFDFCAFSNTKFIDYLSQYCQRNHQQSCYASSPYPSSKWESGYVPKGIKVQQFSNRLTGGSQSEPKRYIDPIVQQQFSIEKLNYKSGGDKFLYLHIMPYSFMTAPFIESMKSIFQKLRTEDTSAISLSLKECMDFFNKHQYYVLPIKRGNTNGILVPNFSEVIGNVISLPVSMIGDNKTEKYLNTIEYVLMIHKHFGVKVLLSESSIPILNLTEYSEIDIFLDGVPSSLRGLIPSEKIRFRRNCDKEARDTGDILWERLLGIRGMYDLLWTDSKENELVAMATSFTRSENHIFFVVDRLIEKKAQFMSKKNKQKKIDKDSVALRLTKQLKDHMERINSVRSYV